MQLAGTLVCEGDCWHWRFLAFIHFAIQCPQKANVVNIFGFAPHPHIFFLFYSTPALSLCLPAPSLLSLPRAFLCDQYIHADLHCHLYFASIFHTSTSVLPLSVKYTNYTHTHTQSEKTHQKTSVKTELSERYDADTTVKIQRNMPVNK